jgi:hypothetical protein
MILLETNVKVKGINAKDIYDFMLNCTDEDYQKWWKDTHLQFHTIKRYPGNLGNLVYVDEFVGKYRLKGHAVVKKLVPYTEMVWQIKMKIMIPAWFIMKFEELSDGVKITHIVSAGFNGVGRIFDPVIRLYLNEDFDRELIKHANEEFPKLAEMFLKP